MQVKSPEHAYDDNTELGLVSIPAHTTTEFVPEMYFKMNASSNIPHKWMLDPGLIHQLRNSELLQVGDSTQTDPGMAQSP